MGALWPLGREHNVKRAVAIQALERSVNRAVTAAWQARFAAPSPVPVGGLALRRAMAQPEAVQPWWEPQQELPTSWWLRQARPQLPALVWLQVQVRALHSPQQVPLR